MKLYAGWSLNPQKALFGLKELKLEAVTVDMDLFKGEQLTKAFTALNPMQKVPGGPGDSESCTSCIVPGLGGREAR